MGNMCKFMPIPRLSWLLTSCSTVSRYISLLHPFCLFQVVVGYLPWVRLNRGLLILFSHLIRLSWLLTSGSPVSRLVWMRIFPRRMSLHTSHSACSMVSPARKMETPQIFTKSMREISSCRGLTQILTNGTAYDEW